MNAIDERGFTGWHMLAIMLAFFGTIISVNVLMAYYAGASWSGMLSKNTYVASQDFNRNAARAREWAKEGLKGDLAIDGDVVHYRLEGPADIIANVDHVEAIFHRPVGDKQDFSIQLIRQDQIFSAPHALAAGPWIVDLAATSHGALVFHEAERIVVEGR
jgi:nitrogen fixation protein FixH